MPKINALIWDMGGVLLRTENREPRRRLGEHYGLSAQDLDYLVFGNPAAQLSESGRFSPSDRWSFVSQKLQLSPPELNNFRNEFWAGDDLDKSLITLITSLRAKFKTGLLSNAGPDASADLGQRYPELLDVFDTVVFSGEVGLVKPDPAIFHLILGRLQVSPDEAIFIDDFKQNILTAQMIGLHTIWFRSSEQAQKELMMMIDSSL